MTTNVRWMAGAAVAGMALTLVGCASESADTPDPVGTWGAPAEGSPQLVLASDGSVTGTDGCNNMTGTWELDGDTVTFGPFAATQMACADVDVWLSGAASATLDANSMDVMDGSGAEIGTLDKQAN